MKIERKAALEWAHRHGLFGTYADNAADMIRDAVRSFAAPEANAIEAIREHNVGCYSACKAQRPNERQSGGCGFQRYDGTSIYSKRCPNCPRDWLISFPLPQNVHTPEKK